MSQVRAGAGTVIFQWAGAGSGGQGSLQSRLRSGGRGLPPALGTSYVELGLSLEGMRRHPSQHNVQGFSHFLLKQDKKGWLTPSLVTGLLRPQILPGPRARGGGVPGSVQQEALPGSPRHLLPQPAMCHVHTVSWAFLWVL